MPSILTDGAGHSVVDGPDRQGFGSSFETFAWQSGQNDDQKNGYILESVNRSKSSNRPSTGDRNFEGKSTAVPNGGLSGRDSGYSGEKTASREGSIVSAVMSTAEKGDKSPGLSSGLSKSAPTEYSYFAQASNGSHPELPREATSNASETAMNDSKPPELDNKSKIDGLPLQPHSQMPTNRYSSPPAVQGQNSQPPFPPQLRHRHTLQVPKITTLRSSREFVSPNSVTGSAEDVISASGRFSPTTSGIRRASLNLARRTTRSVHSDIHLDEVPQDEDAAKWAEAIRQKRASKRKRRDDEDDDRVVVGTKVDQHHVNYVMAYNMLTGIRFTVSRTNAKIDRELTPGDFDAKHKFSFDITGNELTPSAKYDFKFKDYAPWVFRHLRAKFNLDPADYLMSLTSRYILSELGSPGKSGSFFYFSRDYKYIIKTIHPAEHRLLRKILGDYYRHVEDNPNTLLSQFYGLHRVKIPYGKKIHFVVMNNLFPPHRDIHQTFDLKGSTIGRDFREEDLEKNPRATLKDLNWLRRNLHLEFGPTKKETFILQMERDVKLLQKLNIMDYSLLVGIHDLEKGNEENLRDKTLRVFQPGGDRSEDESAGNMLARTPSKLETAKKARELRQMIKREKPVPMDKSASRMPEEMLEERKHFTFYGDDGGFRATHEDDSAGDEIYYLGIIDCLTYYGFVKRAEHFWKGLSNPKSQISPVRPQAYGERFISFITGITKPKEEAERVSSARARTPSLSFDAQGRSPVGLPSRSSTEKVMEKAERQARKTERDGANETQAPDRTIGTVRSPSVDRTTLPVVEEAGEHGSTSGRSREESVPNEKEMP
ncbi:MAG: hypothetical protein M1825_004849 [Sarcosagium campestre]|nr:MAG: hypothetical protein M1825_004849 [Sarcosagium campestre]